MAQACTPQWKNVISIASRAAWTDPGEASGGFEKCVIEQAFAAARTIPADREAARIGASRCGAEARAFAEVRIRQSFAKVPKKLRTHEEKIAWAIGRVQPSFEANAVRYLPEARRTGFKRVILSHPK